jgi:hypothetical protein
VAQTVFKRYEDYSFDFETSRELFYEISGCNPSTATTPANAETFNSTKTTYAYYANPAPESAGNWHKVATIDTNDGAHTAFSYCNEFENRGQIFQIRRPQKNTNPANAGPDANGEITTFAYDFLDYFGTKRLPTSILTTVNGTRTSRTEFSYNYESITDASAVYDSQHPEDAVMPLTVITQEGLLGRDELPEDGHTRVPRGCRPSVYVLSRTAVLDRATGQRRCRQWSISTPSFNPEIHSVRPSERGPACR